MRIWMDTYCSEYRSFTPYAWSFATSHFSRLWLAQSPEPFPTTALDYLQRKTSSKSISNDVETMATDLYTLFPPLNDGVTGVIPDIFYLRSFPMWAVALFLRALPESGLRKHNEKTYNSIKLFRWFAYFHTFLHTFHSWEKKREREN